ncbi:hypothetical protein [Nonomuraea guangzhouensis]|uniref:DUF3558 domain-containing protein n=1 Tax=Nonomuraea guangzhouensis TaxID=1291555 RepID=A0ABW4GDH0_9ACTN|nr:hypothetical protein [Nonomuraea guangzhouensis]
MAGIAAIAICAAAVLIISRTTSGSVTVPTACPQQWGGGGKAGGWVPAAAEVDGVDERLVPGRPVAAMICAYPGDNTHPGGERLAGSRTLTGDAGAMVRDLGYLPLTTDDRKVICSLVGGSMTNYLVRFTYPDGGTLWVGSAEEPNGCVRTTNGTVITRSYVGPSLTAAYRTGAWRLQHPDDPCRGAADRRGQNERMVPDEPVSVLVCGEATSASARPPRLESDARTAKALAETLNSLATRPSENGCEPIAGAADKRLRLVFGYADGPPAGVRIWTSCDPSVDNTLLQASINDSLRDQLTRLAPG